MASMSTWPRVVSQSYPKTATWSTIEAHWSLTSKQSSTKFQYNDHSSHPPGGAAPAPPLGGGDGGGDGGGVRGGGGGGGGTAAAPGGVPRGGRVGGVPGGGGGGPRGGGGGGGAAGGGGRAGRVVWSRRRRQSVGAGLFWFSTTVSTLDREMKTRPTSAAVTTASRASGDTCVELYSEIELAYSEVAMTFTCTACPTGACRRDPHCCH